MHDVKRMINEVAARNRIRIEADDPAFALVTLNELMLEEISYRLASHISEKLAVFDAAMENLEKRAGTLLAQEVKTAAAQVRAEIQSDIDSASTKAAHLVYRVEQAHKRPAWLRSFALALASAVLLSGGSFCLGLWFRLH